MAEPSKPLVIAALGSRGSGKSAWVKRHPAVQKARRLVVWDFMREYQGVAEVHRVLPDAIRAMSGRSWRIAYQADPERRAHDFEFICRAVRAATHCVLVAEELAFVTTPAKAPHAWRELCLLGRHETHAAATVIGISQRPASIDKDFLACADVVHCGRLAYDADARAVAPFIGCDWRDLTRLPDLHYIEKHAADSAFTTGVLRFNQVGRRTGQTRKAAS